MNENYEDNNISEVEEVSTPVENSNKESLGNTTNGEVEVSETTNEAKGSSGKRQYSDLEKAQYSFHKQFSKQKAKYEKMLEDQRKSYEERFDRLEHPEKYKKKTRADFSSDDLFIDHLVEERFNRLMQEQMKAYETQRVRATEQEEVEAGYRDNIRQNVSKLYPDEASKQEYQKVVDAAIEAGLGKVLQTDQEVSMQIITSEYGPKIMYELAKHPDIVNDWFKEGRTSGYRQYMVSKMEDAMRNAKQTPQITKPGVIGKPGIGLNKTKTNIFSSDKALLDFLNS